MKIALGGIAGSGKDYLAKSTNFTRFAFADELKKECARIFPWLEKDYSPIEKEQPLACGMTPRQIWIHVAACLRKVDEDIFIKKLQDHMEMVNVDNKIITDVRSRKELEFCKSQGFTTIFIDPSKQIYEPNDYDKDVLSFSQEFDHVFYNDFNGKETQMKFIHYIMDIL